MGSCGFIECGLNFRNDGRRDPRHEREVGREHGRRAGPDGYGGCPVVTVALVFKNVYKNQGVSFVYHLSSMPLLGARGSTNSVFTDGRCVSERRLRECALV